MPEISGYKISEKISESTNSLIYRALRERDQQAVILKVLKDPHPSPEKVAAFQQEYEITHQLDLAQVVKMYCLHRVDHRWVMEVEDFGGSSLTELALAGQLSLHEFWPLAIDLAEVLGQVHQRQLIHKDINPSNIVAKRLEDWDEAKESANSKWLVKLIDFGLATRLEKVQVSFRTPNMLEGTLPYISPEQTGRMNRALDYRTDLYSLGVTLYELLTGQRPFESDDPMELVHAHLARLPIPPIKMNKNSPIPEALSLIIMKLLAKNAEERYQSAFGLRADLLECYEKWSVDGEIINFEPGQNDFSDRFQIPQKLYGRSQEVTSLMDAFARVAQGAKELLLVAGYSGVGKTVLVHEVHKPITEKRGHFIRGKFDQYQSNIPYSAFVDAFNEQIRLLLSEDDAFLQRWKEKILAAIGTSGAVLIEVIPDLELVIGPQPPVPQLGAQESRNRFNLLFQNFVKALSTAEHPLVIFIDDWQWADSASLELLKLLMSDSDNGYLLLIAAYRDNEVDESHPFAIALHDLERQSALMTQIKLQNLTQNDVGQLLADTLLRSDDELHELTALLYSKTQGNAFFTIQFLQSLYEEGELSFELSHTEGGASGGWKWDVAQIKAKEITDNVVELMANKIAKFPLPCQEVLKIAACIGNEFDLHTLATVQNSPANVTFEHLWPPLLEGLLLPQEENYQLLAMNPAANGRFQFAHDRIQQAAYSLLDGKESQETHLQIGRLLLAREGENLTENLFDIVNQLNLGRVLIFDVAEKKKLAELNLMAGQKAKSATAYRAACNYLRTALDSLAPHNWDSDHQLLLELHQEAAEVEYLDGDFDASHALARQVLSQAAGELEKVKVYETIMLSYIAQNRMEEAIESGLQALDLLGVAFIDSPPQNINPRALLHLPSLSSPLILGAQNILMRLFAPSFIVKPELLGKIAYTMIDLSVKYGNSPLSPYGYVFYGMLLCLDSASIEAGFAFGQLALELQDRFNNREIQCKVDCMYHVFIKHWKEHPTGPDGDYYSYVQTGLETGDLEYAGYTAMLSGDVLPFTGRVLDSVLARAVQYVQLVQGINQPFSFAGCQIWAQYLTNLTQSEANSNPILFQGPYFNESEQVPLLKANQNLPILVRFYLAKTILCYLFEEYEEAERSVELGKPYNEANAGSFNYVQVTFYQSLIWLSVVAPCHSEQSEEWQALLDNVAQNQQKLKRWAEHAPMNHQHKFDLVEAEKARVLGHHWQAVELYDKAIKGARENDYLHEEALANELAAKFWLAKDKRDVGGLYLQKARDLYKQWGAKAKVEQLEAHYPALQAPQHQLNRSTLQQITTSVPGSSRTATFSLDWLSLTKASQAISGEIDLDKLLQKLMIIVLENAGAQRGILLLTEGDDLTLNAKAELDREPIIWKVPPLIESYDELPHALINYVRQKPEVLVIDEALKDATFARDPYIQAQQLQSLLCLPIHHQGQLMGFFYLENNAVPYAFTPQRVEVMQLLASQAAISLQNVRLYQGLRTLNAELEQRVEERTKELSLAKEAAEAANHAKSIFLSNMSHELRTPLNAILGFAEIMVRDESISSKQQENLSIINRSGEHLLSLINDVLDLSKIEAGRATLEERDFDLYTTLNDLYDMFSLRAESKSLQLIFERAPEVPRYIRSDEKKLRQVLINLLNNAIKFTPSGQITLRIGSASSLDRLACGLHFEVSDTGLGIAPEEIDQLFSAFVQTESGRKSQEGTGLGLAISQQFVRLMGGEISVSSQVGQGTTFKFDIPVPVVESSQLDTRRPTRRVIGCEGEWRILVVDDRIENRALLCQLLSEVGFSVQEAVNGEQAIAKWEAWQPHLIWMDMRMPVLDGYEATRRIKSRRKGEGTIIIALTASVLEEERNITLAAGCDDFVRKPFRKEDIFYNMQEHLGVRYIYEELGEPTVEEPEELTSASLAILPTEWRAALRQAVNTGDVLQIFELISEIEGDHAPLAAALSSLANDFDFEKLLDLTAEA